MSVKQSKSKDNHFQIPLVMTDEAIRDFGINPEDVTWRRIGSRRFKTVLVDATEAEYKAYMDSVWSEVKRADREGCCMIPGKNGRLIHCPESRKCDDCERYADICKEKNRPASLQFLIESGGDPVADDSFEDNVIFETILEDLIKMLNEINPMYGSIFRLLFDGTTQQEMADILGMKPRTVSDYVRRIREIVQPLAADIFDR